MAACTYVASHLTLAKVLASDAGSMRPAARPCFTTSMASCSTSTTLNERMRGAAVRCRASMSKGSGHSGTSKVVPAAAATAKEAEVTAAAAAAAAASGVETTAAAVAAPEESLSATAFVPKRPSKKLRESTRNQKGFAPESVSAYMCAAAEEMAVERRRNNRVLTPNHNVPSNSGVWAALDGDWELESLPDFPGAQGLSANGCPIYVLASCTFGRINSRVRVEVTRVTQHVHRLEESEDRVFNAKLHLVVTGAALPLEGVVTHHGRACLVDGNPEVIEVSTTGVELAAPEGALTEEWVEMFRPKRENLFGRTKQFLWGNSSEEVVITDQGSLRVDFSTPLTSRERVLHADSKMRVTRLAGRRTSYKVCTRVEAGEA